MKPNVGIVDYSLGNLFSVIQACIHADLNPILISKPEELGKVDGIILPGVGAFGEARKNLKVNHFDSSIIEFVKKGRPIFGICLGMQLLFESSEELGIYPGLGLVEGTIKKFANPSEDKKVPHTGWCRVNFSKSVHREILEGIEDGELMYFVHSFYANTKRKEDVCTSTNYLDTNFTSSIVKENIFATQFHPEKSGRKGALLYQNWKKTFLS